MAERLIGSPSRAGPARPGGRRLIGCLLVLFVVVVHGCVGREVVNGMALGADSTAPPPRIEAAFVRAMEVTAALPPTARAAAPPEATNAVSPVAHRHRTRTPIRPPLRSASAPVQRPDPAPDPAASAEASAASAAPAGPLIAAVAGSESAASDAAAAEVPPRRDGATSALTGSTDDPASASTAAPPGNPQGDAFLAAAALPESAAASESPLAAFDWPVSTRVSFLLTGYYRGDVNGSAKVEWIRDGAHYQVHLDMVVGPSFAPVISRRMTSDGAITAAGLAPRRYDQETRVMGISRAPVTMRFEPGSVVLANGNQVADRPGVQDTASQFVQLSYVFGTRPELLRIGGSVDIPLALPHKVDVWTYDVVDEETLQTPFGPLASIHLTPRRKSDRSDELTAEIWFAPQLRYLPARIRIQQGTESYLDLMIDRRPDLAGS